MPHIGLYDIFFHKVLSGYLKFMFSRLVIYNLDYSSRKYCLKLKRKA